MNADENFLQRRSSTEHPATNNWTSAPVPSVVVREVLMRPRLGPHIIVFANEKGGVGKSTLAFHSSVALRLSGANVLAIDLDRRQKSLASSHERRDATARALKIALPCCKVVTLEKQSGSLLDQEIRRTGGNVDFVVIDLPGADTATARYALAIADTIVTPIGSSSYDLDGLGQINPTTRKLVHPGYFAVLISELREERIKAGLSNPDWIVMKNRYRAGERRLGVIMDQALGNIAAKVGFRIGVGLHESLSFRDLNAYGLTYLDIGSIPDLGRRNYRVEATIGDLLRQYNLPGFKDEARLATRPWRSETQDKMRLPMRSEAGSKYRAGLLKHKGKDPL